MSEHTGKIFVIGLCGKAGSGKTTAARALEAYGFARLPFAGALKGMARSILTTRQMAGDLKEVPDERLCGKSPRQFMQLLGTEFGRQLIGEDLWVNLWEEELRNLALEGHGDLMIVVDDVRYANEAAIIRKRGGMVFRIERAGAGSATGAAHSSEALSFAPDAVIRNAGSVETLGEAVADAIADYTWCDNRP